MNANKLPVLSAADLVALGRQAEPAALGSQAEPAALGRQAEPAALGRQGDPSRPCAECGELVCPGWESVPGSFDLDRLQRVGTLRRESDDEPTLAEHHPRGTHGWSADAPIAPAFYPYNRCDVRQCSACRRAWLVYTEYGGYYEDRRIRLLDPELVDDTPSS